MAKIKNMGTATVGFKEGVIISGSSAQPNGTPSDYALVVSGSQFIDAEGGGHGLTIFKEESDAAFIRFINSDDPASWYAYIAFDQAENIYIAPGRSQDFYLQMRTGVSEDPITFPFRVFDNGKAKFSHGELGPTAATDLPVDVVFFVSGSTDNERNAVFGGNLITSGNLHVKGGSTVGGATAAAIILDSDTASKIVWDSTDDGNSPDAAIYESGGSLYLSSSNDVRIYAGTDDILLYPRDMLQIIEDENASGNFASFFAQPSDGVYYNVLDVGDTGVTVNDDSRADYDFRVESGNDTHMLFVDGGNDRVGIKTSAPVCELDVNGTVRTKAFGVNVRDVNSTSSVQDLDYVLRCIQSSAITITLPPKNVNSGRVLVFKDTLGNAGSPNNKTITIAGDSNDTIDGTASYLLSDNRESVTLTCDGINGWMITSRYRP
jgi:hypothetical protein